MQRKEIPESTGRITPFVLRVRHAQLQFRKRKRRPATTAGADTGPAAVHENYPPAPHVVFFFHSLGW
jgi:hypothetical protein